MLYQPCLIPDIPRHLCLGVSCQSQIYQKEKCSQISENPILPYFESTHFGFQILIKLRLLIYRFYLFVCSSPFHHFRNSHQLIILWIYNIVDVSILLKTKRESGESWNQIVKLSKTEHSINHKGQVTLIIFILISLIASIFK